MAISKKVRQQNNENSAKFFAAGVGAIMALFIIFHWTRVLYIRNVTKNRKSGMLRQPVALTRFSRYFLARKIYGFPSLGHGLVFLLYFIVNICITFTNIDWTSLTGLSKRLGWVTMANLALVMFLSLKHTPLAFLTAYSYEHLQSLHQVSGYATIACCMIHAVVYIVCWDYSHNLHALLEREQIMGLVAGLSLLILIPTTLLRYRHYEIFHITHSILVALILITAALHRPNLAQHSTYGLIFCATIWVLDRLLRFRKLIIHGIGNKAFLTSLPYGGTKIIIHNHLKGAKPGQHIWIHLPSIRKIELHPFTIVSSDPLELVVTAQDGFTRDLHTFAIANPGFEIGVIVDGPYGKVPDFRGVDKVMFIAAGSGGSYNIGVAVDLLRRIGEEESGSIGMVVKFIWVVRHIEILEWFETYLAELAASPRVKLRLHVTHHHDPEKTLSSPGSQYPTLNGRPNVPALIDGFVKNARKNQRLAVVACGPKGMMLDIKRSVADNLRMEGPALELHGESFGW